MATTERDKLERQYAELLAGAVQLTMADALTRCSGDACTAAVILATAAGALAASANHPDGRPGLRVALDALQDAHKECYDVPADADQRDRPRRSYQDLQTPAEAAIGHAIDQVERAGASFALTCAGDLLVKAQIMVANHVDGDDTKAGG